MNNSNNSKYPICGHWPHAIIPGFDKVTFFGPGVISGDWGG